MTNALPVVEAKVTVTVDGVAVDVPRGATWLDAIEVAGGSLPHLCKPDARAPLGACRTCLVEVEGAPRLTAACHTPVSEGAAIDTRSEKARRVRRGVLDLTAGMSADGRGAGQTAREAAAHDLEISTYTPRPREPLDESNVFFTLNMADCILCGRCVDACQRTQHIGAIGINGRGQGATIGVAFEATWADSNCSSLALATPSFPRRWSSRQMEGTTRTIVNRMLR